jgi:hypothetical protein
MINRPALTNLGLFNSSPSLERLSNLIVIPTVHDVLRYDHDTTGGFDPATLQMCLWLHKRGQEVLEALLRKNGPDTESELAPNVVEKDWRHVSDYFLHYKTAAHVDFPTDRVSLYHATSTLSLPLPWA